MKCYLRHSRGLVRHPVGIGKRGDVASGMDFALMSVAPLGFAGNFVFECDHEWRLRLESDAGRKRTKLKNMFDQFNETPIVDLEPYNV